MRHSTIESLESRQMMTTSSIDAAGTLNITGSSGPDIWVATTSPDMKEFVLYDIGMGGVKVEEVRLPYSSFKKINLHANNGNDNITIDFVSKAMVVFGDAGNDVINGSKRADYIFGGKGNDQINGRGGNDFLFGDTGNDLFLETTDSGTDRYAGGAGTDRITYALHDNDVTIYLDGSATSGEAGEKDTVLSDVENATGGRGNDLIVGNAGANILLGGRGKDKITGMAGNDLVCGQEDNDLLYGGSGSDIIVGGHGHDTMWALDSAGGDTVWGDDVNVYISDWFDIAHLDKSTTDHAFATGKNYYNV
jgi:Ca2+-binding RTX toxin-like protein